MTGPKPRRRPSILDLLEAQAPDATRAGRKLAPMNTIGPALDRGRGADPQGGKRFKDAQRAERLAPLRTTADLISLLPVIGDARSLSDAVAGSIQGDKLKAGVGALAAAVPVLGRGKRLARLANMLENERGVLPTQRGVTVLSGMAGTGLGAAVGGAVDDENPLRGAVAGGLAGAGVGVGGGVAVERLGHRLDDARLERLIAEQDLIPVRSPGIMHFDDPISQRLSASSRRKAYGLSDMIARMNVEGNRDLPNLFPHEVVRPPAARRSHVLPPFAQQHPNRGILGRF